MVAVAELDKLKPEEANCGGISAAQMTEGFNSADPVEMHRAFRVCAACTQIGVIEGLCPTIKQIKVRGRDRMRRVLGASGLQSENSTGVRG